MPPAALSPLAGVPVDVEQQQQHAQPVDDDEQDPEDQCGPEDGAEDTKEFQYDAQEEGDAGADEQQAQPRLVHRIEEDVDHPGQLALRRGFVLAGESSALHGPQALQNGFRVLLRLQRRTRRHLCRGDIQERHVVPAGTAGGFEEIVSSCPSGTVTICLHFGHLPLLPARAAGIDSLQPQLSHLGR